MLKRKLFLPGTFTLDVLQRVPTGKSDDDAKRREVSTPHTKGRERDLLIDRQREREERGERQERKGKEKERKKGRTMEEEDLENSY